METNNSKPSRNFERICIYPKDIRLLTGKSERYCRQVIADIKKSLNKERHQVLTIDEFCQYMGFTRHEVTDKLL